MRPAVLRHARPTSQEDALALHTLDDRCIQQTPLGQWACTAPGGWAWVSVADGVASSPCADLASRSFLQVLHHASPTAARQLPGLVRQARLDWRARYLKPRTRGAACTLASLLVADGQVCAVNSGDSRIWRLRPQAGGSVGSVQWQQLSRDHTAWQQMLDDGEAQAEDAQEYASIYQGLLHCLVLDADDGMNADTDEDATPEDWLHIWHGQAVPGDAYLLATDGLHGVLTDAQMQALWQAADSPQGGLQALHNAYRRTGAQDDVSVIYLEFDSCQRFPGNG